MLPFIADNVVSIGFRQQWPNSVVVHTPIHASWLNQVEVYFSIVQRKVLTPNDFADLEQLEQRPARLPTLL